MEFTVLPDTRGGAVVAAALHERDAQATVIPHASGRPWIVGRWNEGDLVWAQAGRRRIAVLGPSSATSDTLLALLRRAVGRVDPAAAARALAGSFHLLVSDDDGLRVQGSVSAVRRVFHTTVDGTPVSGDRPERLAALTGAGVDEDALPLWLLLPLPPWPLGERCLWRGVTQVPADSYLEIRRDGTVETVRRWSPSPPEVPLSEGAARVRDAVSEAVAVRSTTADAVSADLSGGMDSTSLCFLAARGTAAMTTARFEATDPSNDDELWAARAAHALPGARHVILTRDELPPNFSGLDVPTADVEAPFPWLRARAMLEHEARRLAALGSTGHLTGHGGDELFQALPAYDHALVRDHPLRAVRHLRLNLALRRWRLWPTLRALMDGGSYGDWLLAQAESLNAPSARSSTPSVGWSRSVRLPPWTTPTAAAAARDLLRAAAQDPEPLAPLRGQHQALESVQQCAAALRHADRITSRHGVPWHAPYLDDRVVEAALAVRFADRAPANQYKPVLATAMRGIVPATILGRPTKGEFSADVHTGLRHNKRTLLGLCDDMELARLGLVDAEAFRSDLRGLHPGLERCPGCCRPWPVRSGCAP